MVTSSGARRSTSRANARAARRTSPNVHSGAIRTYTCNPRPPEVFGQPTAPSSSSTSCATRATRRTRPNPQSGIGSRSIRHSSGRSVSARREFHGWNSTVDICTAHTTSASFVTHNSSACRLYRGKCTRTVSNHGGAPCGTRFWCTLSPVTPFGNRCIMHGRSRNARTTPSPTER